MARLKDKSKLLQLLAETPVVSFACKKIGLDRTTFYRWYKDDKRFRDKIDAILSVGRSNINDMAEASVIKEINNGNMRANIFWLQHNHPAYRPVRTTYVDPVVHGHQLVPGEVCRSCGYREPPIEDYKKSKKSAPALDNKTLGRELYKRLRSVDSRKKSETEIMDMIDDYIEKNNIKIEVIGMDFSGKKKNEDDKEKDEGEEVENE